MASSRWRKDRHGSSAPPDSETTSASTNGEPERVDGAPDVTSDAAPPCPEETSVQSRLGDAGDPEGEPTGAEPMSKRARARARRAREEAARARRARRGTYRSPGTATGSSAESGLPLVDAAECEVARRGDELMDAIGQAQRTTNELQRTHQAVTEAEDHARTAAQRDVELRAWLAEERLAADQEAERRRRAEAAALERRARELDEAEAARKRLRLESYRSALSAAAEARADAQRVAGERATEARRAADEAEALARALEAAVGEVAAASDADEKEAVAEAEMRARVDTEAAAAERELENSRTAARVEAFKQAEREKQEQRERSEQQALAAAADHLARFEATIRDLLGNVLILEEQQAEAARVVAAREASVAEAERLADAARNAEVRSREARRAEEAAREGARVAEHRAAAAEAEIERATAQAEEASTQAAALIRQAEQLSAEARHAEQLAAASARALELPGLGLLEEPEDQDERDAVQPAPEIDLTADDDVDAADTTGGTDVTTADPG